MGSNSAKDEKMFFIEYYTHHIDELIELGEETVEEYKRLVEEGAKSNWPGAYLALGLGYQQNKIYKRNWKKSYYNLKKYCELTQSSFAYSKLAMLDYYGRNEEEKPNYEKAFFNFNVAQISGIHEAGYMLSDMYRKGEFVEKNEKVARKLIAKLGRPLFELACRGHFEAKFPDVAYRQGIIKEFGVADKVSNEIAYERYIAAKYILEKRIKKFDVIDDEILMKKIKESIVRVKKKLPKNYFSDFIEMKQPDFIGDLLAYSIGLDVEFNVINGQYYVTAKSVGNDEDAPGRTLVTVGQLKYCKLVDKVGLYIKNPKFTHGIEFFPYKCYISGINYSDDGVWQFMYRDQVMVSFMCDGFVFCEGGKK